MESRSVKYEVNKIINANVNLDLRGIKSILEEKFKCVLSDQDSIYVEDTYVDLLLKKWVQQVPGQVVKAIDPKQIFNFIKQISSVQSLRDCCSLSNETSELSCLILKLYNESSTLQALEDKFVFEFKQNCLIQVQLSIAKAEDHEISFIYKFVKVLKHTLDLQEIKDLFNLTGFVKDVITFKTLLKNILKVKFPDSNVLALQKAGVQFIEQDHFSLSKDLKEIICKFFEQIVIKQFTENGRRVIEVSGTHIVLNRVLEKMENELVINQPDEVRFVKASVLHANVNLNSSCWQGKNLLILAETLIVSDEDVMMDVSGAKGKEVGPNVGDDECGKNGADGMPGESGGNVLLLVESVEGGTLTVKSNGGDGSKGLDGCKGADGVQGHSIDARTMKSKIPPASYYFNSSKLGNLKKTKNSISSDLNFVQVFYYNNTEVPITSQQESLSKWYEKEELEDFYISGKTKEGCEITFSFFYGGLFDRCQSYLLYKGAPGSQGAPGGFGGLGGSAGLAGEIEVHVGSSSKVKCIHNDGNPGENGRSGSRGNPGSRGADCGYMDKTLSNYWPKVFVVHPKDDTMLTIEYSESSTSDSIYCPFKKEYAEIKVKKDEGRTLQHCKFNTTLTRSNCQPLQAVRKKTMDLKNTIGQYETNNFLGIDKLSTSFETVRRILDELIYTDMKTDLISEECKITKQVSYFQNSCSRWTPILEESTFDQLDIHTIESKMPLYKDSRYKLKVLKNIDRNNFQKDFPIKSDLKFLIMSILKFESNEYSKIFSISKTPAEFVDRYFCLDSAEVREEIQKLIKSFSKNQLSSSITVFIKEYGSCKPKSKASIYLKRYHCLKKKLETDVRNVFMAVINVLEQKESRELYIKLCESIYREDYALLIHVLGCIKKDKLLNKLYEHFQAKKKYDWIKAINSKGEIEIKKEMCQEIQNSGPLAEFYREFLSHHFDKNILVFTKDGSGNYKLVSNHNHRSETKIYVLLRDEKFYELNIDIELARLLHYQKDIGQLYSNILFHIDSLTKKEEIDKFATISYFNSDNYKGIDNKTRSYVKIKQILTQDRDIKRIKNIFNSDDLISPRLEKLKANYIGYTNILHYMSLQLENEGRSISTEEFCFVLNFVLESAMTIPTSIPLISWIIASSTPKDWLIEMTLIKLEIYLGLKVDNNMIGQWRQYISNHNEKSKLMTFFEKICKDSNKINDINSIDEVLHLMSFIPKAHVGLEHIDLVDWKYYLKDRYWLHKLKKSLTGPEDFIKQASLYFVLLENSKGFENTNKFLNVLLNPSISLVNEHDKSLVLNALRDLAHKDINLEANFIQTLSKVSLCDWKGKIEKACFEQKDERSLQHLLQLMEECGNTSNEIRHNLRSIEKTVKNATMIEVKINEQGHKQDQLAKWIESLLKSLNDIKEHSNETKEKVDLLKIIIKNVSYKDFIKFSFFTDLKYCKEIFLGTDINAVKKEIVFAAISVAINVVMHKTLRNTQKFSAMMFLMSEKNVLAQISTGEGKSLIVVCLAIMKAINGEKVDIVTSSKVLAERDAKEYSKVYEMFGLTVGHNCSESLEERKRVYSKCEVVYGELSNFQRDFLFDRIYGQNVLGDHNIEEMTIIVDEVDSLILDKASNTLYLSHEIPGLDKLEPLFVYIWQWFNTPTGKTVLQLKERIQIVLGQINKGWLSELDASLNLTKVKKIWDVLVNKGVIDQNGILMKDEIDYDSLSNETKEYINISHLKYMFTKVINSEKQFLIPNYLKSFVHRHLNGWIESAQVAMAMENDKHYVVDIDRSDTSTERNPNIIILDVDTGTDQSNSQWENGLHQFLQLKHGCKLFSMSLKAVFISNVSIIKKYKSLYGLSGTLGTTIERELLTSLYNVEYVTIPTAKAKQFHEMTPISCNNKDDWVYQIISSVYEVSMTRSALIICDNVIDVMLLEENFLKLKKAQSCYEVHTYKRDYQQLKVANNLKQHQIIISTNLAGRGTDIKLSPELIDAGGLHVCLSFLPINSRVGEQAYGRVSRNGQPGTAQMIFMSVCENSVSKITDLQQQRNMDEIHRVTNIKNIYESQILAEEKYFEVFQEQFLNLKKEAKHPEKVKSLLLQVCLDKWAYWLDENVGDITSVSIDKLVNDISNIVKWDFKKDSCAIKDPFQLTKLGLIYLQEKDYETSMFLFDKVIREEKYFSDIALYYRVCTKTAIKDLEPSNILDILDDFTMVQHLLKKQILLSQMSSHCIDWLKSRNANSIIQIDSFKEQQLQKCNIYNIFLQSIYDIIGHEVLQTDLVMWFSSEQDELTAFKVYNKCMEKGVLKMPQLKCFQESDLLFTMGFGIHPEEINRLLKENKDNVRNIFLKNNYLNNYDEIGNQFMKNLKQLLPSRELFWNELIEKKVLVHEVKFIFIDVDRLDQEKPSLKTMINNFTTDVPSDHKNIIWLYKKEEMKAEYNDFVWIVIERNKFMSVIGNETFRYLKKRGIILCNKQAMLTTHLLENKPLKFRFFDSLKESDFIKCGMNIKDARKTIAELQDYHIIKKCKKRSTFSLTSDEEGIEKIQLLQNPAYSSDVKCLLTHHFSFRIAYQKLVFLASHFGIEGDKLILALQPNLYKSFLGQLQENLLTGPRAHFSVSKALQKIYSSSLDTKQWIEVFCKFLNSSYAVGIVDSLKNNKILKQWRLYSQRLIICEKACTYKDGKISSVTLSEPLPDHLEKYKEFVEFILLDYLKLCECFSHDNKARNECVGQIYSKDVPSFDFKPLLSVLNESGLPTGELNTFCLNGFDQLLVVKEKPYSYKMERNVSLLMMGAIAEIAVGTKFLSMFPVFGPAVGGLFQSEGICDVIYGMSSIHSGYFSTSDYMVHKSISLIFSAVSTAWESYGIYQSMYGQQSTGQSMKTIQGKLFDRKVENKENPGAMNIITERIVKASSLAIGVGVKNTMIHQVIRPHLERLIEHLTNMIYSNIDEVIVNHKVIESVRNMYMKYGEDKASTIIQNCFQKAIDEKKVYSNQNLMEVFNLCRTVLNGCLMSLTAYNEGSDANLLEYGLKLAEVFSNVTQWFSKCQKIFSLISDLVSKILNDFDHNLKQSFNGHHLKCAVNIEFNEQLCNHFVGVSIEGWKRGIKSVLSNNINELVLYPLLHHTSNRLQIKLLDFTIKDYSFFSDKEIENISKSKPLHKIQNKNEVQLFESQRFVDTEFNKLLFNILKTNRSASIFSEISKRNLPVDINCVKMCCELIPIILKKEGFEVPPFELVLTINGMEKRYKTVLDGSKCTTVYLTPDEGIVANINNNRVLCITSVLNTIATSILPSEVHSIVGELVSNVLAKMESHDRTLSQLSLNNKPSNSFMKFIDIENENRFADQHIEWSLKSSLHIDLRGELQSCSGCVEKYIQKGFETALTVINEFISTVLLSTKHSINLELQDFKELDFDLWPNFEPSGFPFHCQPVSYELMLPIPKDKEEDTFQKFLITMKLNNRSKKRSEHRSRGAHIMYEVHPSASRANLYKSMRGYVLLSAECQRITHTVEQCHVAGELITPTRFKVSSHKYNYDVLVIGDTEFKRTTGSYIEKHSSFKCKILNYKKSELGEIKNEVIRTCYKYRGARCAVLYIGTSAVSFADYEEETASKISEIVFELQSCLESANIILCSLEIQNSQNSSKMVKQVRKINEFLNNLSILKSFTYLELMAQGKSSWIPQLKWIPNIPWMNKNEDLIIKQIEIKLNGTSQY